MALLFVIVPKVAETRFVRITILLSSTKWTAGNSFAVGRSNLVPDLRRRFQLSLQILY